MTWNWGNGIHGILKMVGLCDVAFLHGTRQGLVARYLNASARLDIMNTLFGLSKTMKYVCLSLILPFGQLQPLEADLEANH